jgi:uncharacterized membrane protein
LANRKLLFSFLLCLILAINNVIIGIGEADYTPKGLNIQLYPDGIADIEYTIETDPEKPRINVTLFGLIYSDLIILDQDELPLDYTYNSGYITIDTLGSRKAEIFYSTSDLTNKTASTWSLSLIPSTEALIMLPIEATILGLVPTPNSITITGTGIILSMPPLPLKITYTLVATGTKEIALAKITEAEEIIQEIKLEGINITDAEQLLLYSQRAYSGDNYIQAENYAEQAINEAQNTQTLANDAIEKINEASNSLLQAQESGRTSSLQEANIRLNDARNAYSTGDYEEANRKAVEAIELANTSKTPSKQNSSIYILFMAGISLLGLALLRYRNREIKEEKPDKIDLQRIYEQNPQLRQDEREVIKLISKTPDGLFASDIREKFDLPRSTAWRMINRLEEADILRTSLIGRETHVEISEKYRRIDND